jgi:hypothetical protein
MQKKDVGHNRPDHRRAEPKCREAGKTRNEQGKCAGEFHERGHDPEPLAETDLIEHLYHHWVRRRADVVAADLADGSLVSLRFEDASPQAYTIGMSAVFPAAAAPGPAGRWLIDRLQAGAR